MKKLIALLCIFASACSTVSSLESNTAQMTAIATVIQSGTATAVSAVIAKTPGDSVYFGLASDALQLAVNQGTFDSAAIVLALNGKIPTQYQGDVNTALNSALAAYSLFYAANLNTWKTTTGPLDQLITAIQAGITQGLGPAATTPAGPAVESINQLTIQDLTLPGN
jgi:hypothetical protein